MNPDYPIYIISKGRWESRLTSKALEEMKVPYHIVVEPQEYDNYASVIDSTKILVLPFQDLGQGSVPARNWVWNHSIGIGAERHWILDDNIRSFFYWNRNAQHRVKCGNTFKAIEDYVNRFTNIALAGMQYHGFAVNVTKRPPVVFNRRIYSCILIKNDLKYRWRGKYNEDTDLSLCALKDGWCTALFYAFLCEKMVTMSMEGGNTEELYIQDKKFDGRHAMAMSLKQQHPDLVKVKKRWGRWQHVVDYKPFQKNKLIKKENTFIPKGINNYNMQLVNV